ncbi:MAG: hypothetical protein R6X02_19395 [Enhygromyxa sp.]
MIHAIALVGASACATERPSPKDGEQDTTSSESDPATSSGDGSPSETAGRFDSDTSAGDGDSDSDERPECRPAALMHAPAPVEIDGLTAVPIDILELEAELSFDVAAATAFAQGTLRFALGEAGGMPIFDLRQTPETLRLDGRLLAPDQLARQDFGVGVDFGFRILEVELAPCSVHELEFAYPLTTPQAPLAVGPRFASGPDRVYFDLSFSDLEPGRYLESWLPANMPWDRHPISLAVTLTQAGAAHALLSNATVDEVAPHGWQLEFPATTTAMDPMLVLIPIDELDSQTGVHRAVNGQAIPYAVHVNTQIPSSAAIVATEVTGDLDEFVTILGDFAHPELTVYIHPITRSMEYAGATTSSLPSLAHELFHSWWARGLSPASYADGWIDEGWVMFNIGPAALLVVPFDWAAPPRVLFDPHPFARDTPTAAYTEGRLLFAGLAELMGVEGLHAAMAELYASRGPLGSLSTAQLERHLFCASGELPEIRQAFHRFVRGLDGDAGLAPDGYCD